ncbi:hypothetical protein J6590_007316 [Homalodisca vitripennis]|nr:hypothetical protein J6590_007316 [Homalodisca vitripennis]
MDFCGRYETRENSGCATIPVPPEERPKQGPCQVRTSTVRGPVQVSSVSQTSVCHFRRVTSTFPGRAYAVRTYALPIRAGSDVYSWIVHHVPGITQHSVTARQLRSGSQNLKSPRAYADPGGFPGASDSRGSINSSHARVAEDILTTVITTVVNASMGRLPQN